MRDFSPVGSIRTFVHLGGRRECFPSQKRKGILPAESNALPTSQRKAAKFKRTSLEQHNDSQPQPGSLQWGREQAEAEKASKLCWHSQKR